MACAEIGYMPSEQEIYSDYDDDDYYSDDNQDYSPNWSSNAYSSAEGDSIMQSGKAKSDVITVPTSSGENVNLTADDIAASIDFSELIAPEEGLGLAPAKPKSPPKHKPIPKPRPTVPEKGFAFGTQTTHGTKIIPGPPPNWKSPKQPELHAHPMPQPFSAISSHGTPLTYEIPKNPGQKPKLETQTPPSHHEEPKLKQYRR